MRVLSAFLFFLSFQAHAEYRMFLLEITSADGAQTRQVPSTLDPDQYRGYHVIHEGEKISYQQTWMCKGRTNEAPPCPNPRDPASVENPNSPASP